MLALLKKTLPCHTISGPDRRSALAALLYHALRFDRDGLTLRGLRNP